jgi:hypothetical protein
VKQLKLNLAFIPNLLKFSLIGKIQMIASTKRATQTAHESSLAGTRGVSRKSRHGTDYLCPKNKEYPEGL